VSQSPFAPPAAASVVPLFALFALTALFNWAVMNSNNAKGGTGVVDAAKRLSRRGCEIQTQGGVFVIPLTVGEWLGA
jgi:hypothetical protein